MKEKESKGQVSKLTAIILCAIFIPIIIINTIMIIKTYANPDHLPGVFGIKPAIVLSGSMSPVFEEKALVFIKKIDTDKLKKDDIICFLQNGTATTHRIYEVVNKDGQISYITKGDANNTTDDKEVTPDQVEGIYIGHIAKLGGFAMFMQSTTGMILFIVVPVVLYLGFDILSRKLASKKESDRTSELEAELAALKAKQKQEEEKSSIE